MEMCLSNQVPGRLLLIHYLYYYCNAKEKLCIAKPHYNLASYSSAIIALLQANAKALL